MRVGREYEHWAQSAHRVIKMGGPKLRGRTTSERTDAQMLRRTYGRYRAYSHTTLHHGTVIPGSESGRRTSVPTFALMHGLRTFLRPTRDISDLTVIVMSLINGTTYSISDFPSEFPCSNTQDRTPRVQLKHSKTAS
jgi:hypothetical protein